MFLNRKLNKSSSSVDGRSLQVRPPPPPADEPQPNSPASDDSFRCEGGQEVDMSLCNPWPPTPPQASTSLAPSTDDPQGEQLIAAASKPGEMENGRFIRTFSLIADQTPMLFMIAVTPVQGKMNHYTFSLSWKAGGVHRSICQPVTLKLTLNPRQLTYNVFLFPPKHSLPKKCLYSLRVWLRHQNVDHRIFADDALWVGTDPDFAEIPDATLATVWHQASDRLFYKCLVGRAEVNFILRWEWLKDSVFSLNFEYEAGGVGKPLLENMIVRLDFPPQELGCHIYTIPLISKPAGATHRVRVWLKSPSPFNRDEDPHQSYTYQRIWSTDEFRVGGYLNFLDIDPKRVILAAPLEKPPLRVRTTESALPGRFER